MLKIIVVIIYFRVSSPILMKFKYVVGGMILNNFSLYTLPPMGFSFRDIHTNILVGIYSESGTPVLIFTDTSV